jgi:predicted Holliday junction resolvase-like endonuclease
MVQQIFNACKCVCDNAGTMKVITPTDLIIMLGIAAIVISVIVFIELKIMSS